MSRRKPEGTFIRVDCPSCKNPDVWFKCNSCSRSDHFHRSDSEVVCDCEATYTTGICTCGTTVNMDGLIAVPFDQGPMALADLEVDWSRAITLVGLFVLIVLVIGYALWA